MKNCLTLTQKSLSYKTTKKQIKKTQIKAEVNTNHTGTVQGHFQIMPLPSHFPHNWLDYNKNICELNLTFQHNDVPIAYEQHMCKKVQTAKELFLFLFWAILVMCQDNQVRHLSPAFFYPLLGDVLRHEVHWPLSLNFDPWVRLYLFLKKNFQIDTNCPNRSFRNTYNNYIMFFHFSWIKSYWPWP